MSTEPKLPSASELLIRWKSDLAERDQAVESRRNDMFRGRISIEESQSIMASDLSMTMWYFNKLIAIVAAQEPATPSSARDVKKD